MLDVSELDIVVVKILAKSSVEGGDGVGSSDADGC